ncbi:elongation factor P maturation arginine rhamnosyltransferase EarP [Cellvibrio sp. PSBB023]|uniref:elongation factor P maturation arginine rhamnosyltransferase EarP n=1 Tax=Cellvibrio sp. PSBB023 TaxID=1945512 RepID=UPI00098E8BF7|nr:elongation factor P maturation arginine rhamnosyltransferase EarP [Cellvibrio sp. PSBB023]AQT59789.1 hypothetical protein B0D95_06595 [Cellvibrio sp. PSBB023]
MPATTIKTWDIFCRVIDNFGDIGVCWRLARQLAAEHQQKVRLWVDDIASLQRIWPDTLTAERQMLAGVEVRVWHTAFDQSVQPAEIVIEAFACDIPPTYLGAMAAGKAKGQPPLWINLEYLSAEAWVEECHGMASVHPATGLRKTFFFPGFTERTGGLLREQSILAQRDAFNRQGWLAQMGIDPVASSLLISLFAYENAAIHALLNAWQQSPHPIHCLVPEGKILGSINSALGKRLNTGDLHQSANLTLQIIPFVTQTEYDKLLWACDINFVRGEDSFVRAQWAGKPVVWHIYVQDDDAHLVKLQAFLRHYTTPIPTLTAAINQFWIDWNEAGHTDTSWNQLIKQLPEWREHCRHWSQSLSQAPDLAQQLYDYCLKRAG